jgi:phosphinothricin acetyltransferase
MDDAAFLEAFETLALPWSEWTHRAHVRLAWATLARLSYDEALSQVRRGIRRYNGTAKPYLETVTVAFLRLIHHRRLLGPRPETFADFCARNPDLLARDPPALARYYSPERLLAAAAREELVPPDRCPLPAAGTLRMATPDDAASILAVYAPYIRDTVISFELEVPTVAEMRERIRETLELAPWLVWESEGEIAGYAYASRHRERAAYQWSIDVSVYVARGAHRTGLGRLLYTNLLRMVSDLGYHRVFAGITLPNDSSVGLHESMGFRPVGVYRAVGFKLGAWHDVGWWQLSLRPPEDTPSPPRRPGEVTLLV